MLLLIDLILVVISLEIYIQILILKARAVDFCLQEYESARAIPLPLVDTDCNTGQLVPCDPAQSDEYYIAQVLNGAEITIAIISCLILCTFLAESAVYMAALGVSFFKSFFFVFDLVVVLVSMSLEIWAITTRGGEQLIVGFFIIARMWRFLRVPHNVYVLDHAEAVVSSAERASSRNPTPLSFTPAPSTVLPTSSTPVALLPLHTARKQSSVRRLIALTAAPSCPAARPVQLKPKRPRVCADSNKEPFAHLEANIET